MRRVLNEQEDPIGGELFHERVDPFRQIGLRQIRRGPAQHFVFLLEQLDPQPGLAQLTGLAGALARPGALVNVCLAHPLVQRHRVHTEIRGDLLDRHTVIAVASYPYDVVAELTRVTPGHKDVLPACPHWASQLRYHLSVQQTQCRSRARCMKKDNGILKMMQQQSSWRPLVGSLGRVRGPRNLNNRTVTAFAS